MKFRRAFCGFNLSTLEGIRYGKKTPPNKWRLRAVRGIEGDVNCCVNM